MQTSLFVSACACVTNSDGHRRPPCTIQHPCAHHPSQAAFDRGLIGAATAAKAWLITSGSNAGVMRLVGDAVRKHEVSVPLIGIFPWGTTNCRERLDDAIGKVAPYGKATPASRDGAPLNRDHTHFILVDSGAENGAAWGTEIALRSELEATISNTKGVPIVQLVVQGGPGTLATVESIALEGKPIVILTNSGGAATAIYNFCKSGLSAVEEKFRHMEARLANIKLINDAYSEKLLSFYTLDDSASAPDLSSLLLGAIVNILNTDPDLALLPVGGVVKHPEYGRGRISEVTLDGDPAVTFESGERRIFSESARDICHMELVGEGSGPGDNPARRHTLQLTRRPTIVADASINAMVKVESYLAREASGRLESSVFDAELSKALSLTVVWDRPELALQIMGALKQKALLTAHLSGASKFSGDAADVADGEVGSRLEVAASFQRALELQRKMATELLITLPGLEISRVNMGRLFQQHDVDDAQFLSLNGLLQIKLHQFINKAPYIEGLNNEAIEDNFDNFREAAAKFYSSLSPILGQQLRSQHCLPTPSRPLPSPHLHHTCWIRLASITQVRRHTTSSSGWCARAMSSWLARYGRTATCPSTSCC